MSAFKKNGVACCKCDPTSCLTALTLPQVCTPPNILPSNNRWGPRPWGQVYRIKQVVDGDGKLIGSMFPGSNLFNFAGRKPPFTATVTGNNGNITFGPDATTTFEMPPCYPPDNFGYPDPRAYLPLAAPQIISYRVVFSFGVPGYFRIFYSRPGGLGRERPANWILTAGGASVSGSTVIRAGGAGVGFNATVDVPYGDGSGTLAFDLPPIDDVFYYRDQNGDLQQTPQHWDAIGWFSNFCYYFCWSNVYGYATSLDSATGLNTYPMGINCIEPVEPPYVYPSNRGMMAQMAGPFAPLAQAAGPPPAPPEGPPARPRVGLLAPCLRQGGAEAWQNALVAATADRLDWQGLAVLIDPAEADPAALIEAGRRLRVTFGAGAARELAAACDVLISWCVVDHGPVTAGLDRPPAVIFADHFAHDGPWDAASQAALASVAHVAGVSELCSPGHAGFPRTSTIWPALDASRLARRAGRDEVRARWGIPEGAPVAGFYGRISPEKRPDAMARLAAELPPEWCVVVVGDRSARPVAAAELAAAVAALPEAARGRVRVLDADPSAGDVLSAFDVLVVPSATESFGLTLAEGLALGVPVVATPVGLARLHPEVATPIRVDASGAELAAAVLSAYADGPRLEAGRVLARCSPEAFGSAWADLVAAYVPGPSPPPPGDLSTDDFHRALMAADVCPDARGSCGCGTGPPRRCLRAGRPDWVRRPDCIRCQVEDRRARTDPDRRPSCESPTSPATPWPSPRPIGSKRRSPRWPASSPPTG